MAQKIQIRRGTKSELDGITLSNAELGYTTDTNEIYIGTGIAPSADGHHLVSSVTIGLSGDKPIPEIEGRFYFDTDTDILYLDDGTDWVAIGIEVGSYIAGDGISITTSGSFDAISVNIGAGIEIDNNKLEVKLFATEVLSAGDEDVNNNPIYKDSDDGLNVKMDHSSIGLDADNYYRLQVEIIDGGNFVDALNGYILNIQCSQIDSDLTSFPVMLTEANLPLEMFDADGLFHAQVDGGDIRFYSDLACTLPLACDIKLFSTDNDPNNGKAIIWIAPSLISSSSDTPIYVRYGDTGQVQPARDSVYGSEKVWDSNYFAVYHFNETTGLLIDSTSYINHGTCVGLDSTERNQPGDLTGNAFDFDGTEYINLPDGEEFKPDYVTMEIVLKVGTQKNGMPSRIFDRVPGYTMSVGVNGSPYDNTVFSKYGFAGEVDSFRTVYSASATGEDGIWHAVASSCGDEESKFYTDGNLDDTNTQGGEPDRIINHVSSMTPRIAHTAEAGEPEGQEFVGLISELRLAGIERSDAWCKAITENAKNPSTFVIVGASV